MSLSKPRPILKDMPYHIKKMIVESIPSYLDRLPLRKTSKEFMGVVDTAKVEISFEINQKSVRMEWKTPNSLVKRHPTTTDAINHFKCFVSKENVTFSSMGVSGNRALYVEVVQMLSAAVKRPLRVKKFAMIRGGQARILEFIEPGTLEQVALLWTDQVEAESIFRMEHWRQVQDVVMMNVSVACEIWWHIPSFYIYHNESIKLIDLPRILEHLSNSNTFVSGKIFTSWTIEAIVEALGGDGWQWNHNGARQFAEKGFAVRNRGSTIVVEAFHRRVEFKMNRTEE